MMIEQNPTVCVIRQLSASPDQVFNAWLEPEKVKKWMFPNDELVRIDIDARVGGTFSFVVRRNGNEIEHIGKYLEIDRPRRLVFTWATVDDLPDVDYVIIDIVPTKTGSQLTLTHELDPNWADYTLQAEKAWNYMLEAMDKMLSQG